MKVGLTEFKKRKKKYRVREIQALAHTPAWRQEKGWQEIPCAEDLELHIQVFNLII